MSVDRYHYDLEALFGFSEITSESSTHDSEQLILHKDFQRQTQRFSLYGVSIDKIEVEQLLGFVIKVIYARYVGTLNGSFSNMANCLFPMLQILLRRRICPHTDGFGALGSWDAIFFDVIENIVLPSILMPAWKRMYKGLVLNDLQSSNFEGTGSAVMQMHRSIAKLAETVPYGNICDLQEVLRDCCIMDNWFTPRCVRIGLLDRWSLLHLAASSATASKEVLLYLVQQVGCETSFTDIKGRTALHIAALALNYEGVLYLSTVSPAAVKVTDTSGKTPLALLLHSVSLCSWQKKAQSHRMQQMITALIPAANPEFIWHCEYQENLQSDNNHPQLFSAGINDTFATSTIPIVMFSSQAQCQHLAFLKSCLFYRAVTLTDDGVADEVVRIAKSCASSVRWHIEVAKEAICTCIRDPRVRVSTVKLLLQEFFPVGVDEGDACVGRENQQQQHLQSLDLCLCHAVVSAKHAKTEKVVLKTLLDLFSNHLVPSKVNNVLQSATSAGPFAFIYLSVLSGDPVLLTVVLAALPRKVVQDLVYSQHAHCVQPELIDVECQFDYDNCRRHLEFFIPSDSTSVFWALMKHPHISPMSLACAMGSAEMVNTLLRACYVAPGSQRSGERQEKEHYFPARYCVAVGAAGCLRIIKNVHSVESFYELCYTAKGQHPSVRYYVFLLSCFFIFYFVCNFR